MDSATTAQSEKISATITRLTDHQLSLLHEATHGHRLGGDPVSEPFRSEAVKLELAYRATGRLRANVYNLLRGGGTPSTPVLVKAKNKSWF